MNDKQHEEQSPLTMHVCLVRKLDSRLQFLKSFFPLSSKPKRNLIQSTTVIVGPHKLTIHDCIACEELTWQDIEHLQKKCPEPDLVLFCTPLLNNHKPQDRQKIQANDAETISFFSKSIIDKQLFWSKTLFVLSKEQVKDETSKKSTNRITSRIKFLKGRVETSSCLKYQIKHVIVNDIPELDNDAPWKKDMLDAIASICGDELKARNVFGQCLSSL